MRQYSSVEAGEAPHHRWCIGIPLGLSTLVHRGHIKKFVVGSRLLTRHVVWGCTILLYQPPELGRLLGSSGMAVGWTAVDEDAVLFSFFSFIPVPHAPPRNLVAVFGFCCFVLRGPIFFLPVRVRAFGL